MARPNNGMRIFAATAVALVAAALVFLQLLDSSINERSAAPAGTRIKVPAGASLRSVLAELSRVQAVRRPRLVEWYLRLHGQHLRAQVGTYELAEGATAQALLNQLNAGQVVLAQLTIVEGWTFAQMRAALNASADLAHEWQHLDEAALMRALGQPGLPAEGRFFPDTYRFAAGTSDRRIYELALQRMSERLRQEWDARAPMALSVKSADAALITGLDRREGNRHARTSAPGWPRCSSIGCAGHAAAVGPDGHLWPGHAYDGNMHGATWRPTDPTTATRAPGCRPRRSRCPEALRCTPFCIRPTSMRCISWPPATATAAHHFSATLCEHMAALRAYLKRTGAVPDAAPGEAPK
jgi:UPF0755 protein